jgi:enolase
LSGIPVGVDPVNFTLRRPAASAAFRMLVEVFGGGKWLKEKSLCISKGMDSAFGKSLEKYRENMDLFLENIKRSGYGNMNIIYVEISTFSV